MFADDIKLYHRNCSPKDCAKLQHDIDTYLQWSKEFLSLFQNVYKVLHIGNIPYAGDYTLGHTHLELLDNI